MNQTLGTLTAGLLRRMTAARKAGDGPDRIGAPLGFAKVCKAAASDPNISDATYRVLGLVAAYADEHGICWPAVGTIARERGVTRQAIQHHLRILIANKYLAKQEQKRKNGGYGPNLYHLTIRYASGQPQPPRSAIGRVARMLPSGNHTKAADELPKQFEGDASELDCIDAAE